MKLQRQFSAALLAAAFSATLAISGCNTDTGITAIDNPPTLAAPLAANINLTGLGGAITQRDAANGLLSVGTPNGATANAALNQATALGGRVTINNDGSFTYQAPLTGNTNDSFTYTLTNSGGSSTATVTIALGAQAFFVKNDVTASGNGQQATPFKTLAEAAAAANGVNAAEIVVFPGDGTTTGYNTAITLGGNQTLRGFSPAATPLMTGPVVFTSGNKLQDVRINGTPATASAVNAVGASNGTIDRVAFSNCTTAGNLTDATGAWVLSNGSVQNMGLQGFVGISSTGSASWGVNNYTFNNTTICAVCTGPTATAAHNLTINNSTFNGGGSSKILAQPNTNGTAVGLNVNNCTVNGGGTALRGIDVTVQGTTAFTALLTSNNITGCTGQGIQVGVLGNSSARIKFDRNRTLGNSPNFDLSASFGGNSTGCLVYTNNTANQFGLGQNSAGSTVNVEQFASFGTRNTGTLTASGTITDVAAGFCGLP